ncbi:MAG TPA: hypothetical protein V6D48_15175 [Oculatellaceae cyanobacterium]
MLETKFIATYPLGTSTAVSVGDLGSDREARRERRVYLVALWVVSVTFQTHACFLKTQDENQQFFLKLSGEPR